MQKISETTSIKLPNELALKIDNYLLDSYSLKKYGGLYLGNSKQVNNDIRGLCVSRNLKTVREIKYHLTLSLLSTANKKAIIKNYS